MKISLRLRCYLLLGAILCSSFLFAPPIYAQNTDSTLYLAFLASHLDDCAHTDAEQALVELMQTAPSQGRATLRCNLILQRTARTQSQDMAERGYCTSVDPDGYGPNYRVRTAGYVLPQHYSTSQDANNVQTVACGYTTAQELWDSLLPDEHLEGKGDFWSKQVEYGIAYYEAPITQFVHYWVIITAEPGQ